MTSPPRHRLVFLVLAALLLGACARKAAPPAPPPVEVGVLTAHAQPVPLTRELVGRLSATRSADVRARVAGVLQKRLYKEGSLVKAGQPLFAIDPAPFQAALNGAKAALAQAEAAATNAHITAQRNRDIAAQGLVSKATLDESEAAERSTAAQVLQAKANLEVARINLGYATVTSPISGRSGQQRVTEGALVGQGEATLLTVVEQIDPIYVNFDQPAADVERLRRLQASGDVELLDRNSARVQVILQDGTPYPHEGTLDFLDYSVNPTTGALAFRGVVPNPDYMLLPGMYVNIRLTLGQMKHAFLVPAAAVQRDDQGPFVKVVGPDNKVVQKRVTADTLHGSSWVVTSGIAEGDRVIVVDVQKARPGAPVTVTPAEAPAEAPASAPGHAGGSVPSGEP
ncbi:MAG TPA: efflux RND transporter periplasmic adaptor subunit [Steroidobacteraceae bacterium]|nr:efflux RND transporter periplasmic adaptor subunit [Steroidobacteraceae bacterium]